MKELGIYRGVGSVTHWTKSMYRGGHQPRTQCPDVCDDNACFPAHVRTSEVVPHLKASEQCSNYDYVYFLLPLLPAEPP